MQTVQKISVLDQNYPQLKSISYTKVSVLERVKNIETEHSDSNFTLLKRFLKELQLSNNSFAKTYNREVI